jgi:hypothetical protein
MSGSETLVHTIAIVLDLWKKSAHNRIFYLLFRKYIPGTIIQSRGLYILRL